MNVCGMIYPIARALLAVAGSALILFREISLKILPKEMPDLFGNRVLYALFRVSAEKSQE